MKKATKKQHKTKIEAYAQLWRNLGVTAEFADEMLCISVPWSNNLALLHIQEQEATIYATTKMSGNVVLEDFPTLSKVLPRWTAETEGYIMYLVSEILEMDIE